MASLLTSGNRKRIFITIMAIQDLGYREELAPHGEQAWESRGGLQYDGAPTAAVSVVGDYDDRRALEILRAREEVYTAIARKSDENDI
ncbi:MAG: hypothetical protein JWM52_610 [Candidatus Saccharibacteria bacterium]|nr:hypothetical protein [Candidatus Saccharibacteria bacterium]